jgi:peptidoglycan/LPS O-acetylase OafA/YrhL
MCPRKRGKFNRDTEFVIHLLEPRRFKGIFMKDVSIRKYDYIDALRGFAIMGVVLVHSSQWVSPTSGILSAIASEGARGVQLFYIASALTLFLSMTARKQDETRPLAGFFIRRFFRIAPLFYLAIIAYTFYDGMSHRYWAPNGLKWWYIFLTAFFMHGWHPETITSVVPGGWSIAVEMTFYLFVPYLFSKLTDIKSTLVVLFCSLILSRVLSSAAVHLFSPYYPDSQQYLVHSFSSLWFVSQLPVFMLGILLYQIIKKYPDKDKQTASFLLCVSLFLFIAFLNVHTFGDLLPKHVLYGIAFLMFSLSLHFSPRTLLVNSITTLIGRLSFSIYIVHVMVLNILHSVYDNGFILKGNSGFIAAFLLVLVLSTGVSYVTHKFVEVPGINLGKKIIKKL